MTILASDTFDRADGTLGANWSPNPTPSTFNIVSNAAKVTDTTVDNTARYNAITWPNNYVSEIIFDANVKSDGVGVGYGASVRCDTGGAEIFYRLIGNGSGFELGKDVSGTFTNLASGSGTTFTAGDRLGLQFNGSTPTLFKNGTSFGGPPTDSAITSGAGGIAFSSTEAVASNGIASWSASDLAAFPAIAPPFRAFGPGMGPALRRRRPQVFPDDTIIPVVPTYNPQLTIFRRKGGPSVRGPAGRTAIPKYPEVASQTIINAGVGSYTWQGKSSPLSKMINASVGVYTWVGKASPLSKMINASVGSYTWQGKTSPLSKMINASVGTYTWQGRTSPLSKMINAGLGVWTWSGTHADLGGVVIITATPGQYSWSGVPAQIQQIITINAQIGVYSWGGVHAQVTTTQVPSKGLAQYGVSFRRKRSQMDEPPDLDVRSALQEVLISKGLIEKVEYSVSTKPVSETEELVEIKVSGLSKRDLQVIVISLLASDL